MHTNTSSHSDVAFLCVIKNPRSPTEPNSSYLFAFTTLTANLFASVIEHPHNLIDRMSSKPRVHSKQKEPIAHKRITLMHIREHNSESLLCKKVATSFSSSLVNAKNITDCYYSHICVSWPHSIDINLFSI